ncbi:hypothetical protein MMC07_001260 [Pseudocyphellaria aurata]|nr:hypothetical protein [Pseudocyphellaria aurata]
MTSGQGLKRTNRSPESTIDPELSKSSRTRSGSKAVFSGGKEGRSGPPFRAQSAAPSSELSTSSRALGTETQESRALGPAEETRDRSEYSKHSAEKENGPSRVREVQGAAVFEENASEVEKAGSSKTRAASSCCCNNPRESTPPAEPEVRRQEISSPLPFSPLIDPIATTSFYQDSYSRPTVAGSDKSKSPEDSSFPHGFSHFHPIPQTTVYSMPATYATAENPLTARQQEYFQRNSHVYSQQVPHYAPLGVIGSAAPPAEGADILSLSHDCTCGPSCQCIFCVAHPFNEPTRDRVQSLAHLLSDEGEYAPKSPLQPSYGSPFHSATSPSSVTSTSHRMHIGEILHPSNLPQSRAFTSGDYGGQIYPELPSGSLAETQQPAVSSSGYLTMAYDYDPLQLNRCTDSTGTCRCGDSCTCVGCFIHSGHNGDML